MGIFNEGKSILKSIIDGSENTSLRKENKDLNQTIAELQKTREGKKCPQCGKFTIYLNPEHKERRMAMRAFGSVESNIKWGQKHRVYKYKHEHIDFESHHNLNKNNRMMSDRDQSVIGNWLPVTYSVTQIKYREWYCDGNVGGCGHVVREDERNGKFDDNFFK